MRSGWGWGLGWGTTSCDRRPLPLLSFRVLPIVFASACIIVPGATLPSTPAPDGPAAGAGACGTVGGQVVELINLLREDAGLPALVVDTRLVASAGVQSDYMAARGIMSHTGPGGSTTGQRAAAAGYGWSWIAENVAVGQAAPREVVAGWRSSAGHRANMLDRDARHVGIGYSYNADNRYRHFWVAVFGLTRGATAPPAGGCHP
ncbi:MAG: CAP domain-containing protein [Longimicrobiales bacterium]